LVAWIIGWDLIIEYAIGNGRGHRAGYFNEFLRPWESLCRNGW
jgi:hypothetical protein